VSVASTATGAGHLAAPVVASAGQPPIVLVAHGSRDPAAARSTLALRDAVAAAQPGRTVLATFLDFDGDRPAATLIQLGGPAVVVPLLLTDAYHGTVDVPGEVARVRAAGVEGVRLATVLGPVDGREGDGPVLDLLVDALLDRLGPAGSPDGLVLAGAGSRHLAALATVDVVAAALAERTGVPVLAGYASGAGRSVATAVADLATRGCRRIAMATYFLAPGRLYDRAVAQARAAGAVAVAPTLDASPGVVAAVLRRAAEDHAP
jgi:sirohydrochlorin ferrochelatase